MNEIRRPYSSSYARTKEYDFHFFVVKSKTNCVPTHLEGGKSSSTSTWLENMLGLYSSMLAASRLPRRWNLNLSENNFLNFFFAGSNTRNFVTPDS